MQIIIYIEEKEGIIMLKKFSVENFKGFKDKTLENMCEA